jgi:hypothetical protein
MTGTFAEHALELRRHGFAVLPATGKHPVLKGYDKHREPLTAKSIAALAKKFPDANVCYQAGPSGVVVVDADDTDAGQECLQVFGSTPGRVRTRRGEHFLYRDTGTLLSVTSLRSCGINADLKAGYGGRSVVIAPPSVHPKGGQYAWLGCDPSVRGHLPPFPVERLTALLERSTAQLREATAGHRTQKSLRDGSRGLGLNDYLCYHAPHCDTFDEVLDCARTWNEEQPRPLLDAEVMNRVRQVWNDVLDNKLTRQFRREATAQATNSEIHELNLAGHGGSDALTLLLFLRTLHGARTRRGETFSLNCKAMEASQSLPRWTRKRIAAAIQLLLDCGKLVRIRPAHFARNKGAAGVYTLERLGGEGGRVSYISGPESTTSNAGVSGDER